MDLLRLPLIALLRVFFYLDVASIMKTAKVCRKFRKCCKMMVAASLDLDLRSEWRTLETFPKSCSRFTSRLCTKISLRWCTRVKKFDFMTSFDRLTIVDLYGTNVKDCQLNAICTSVKLTAINLGYCRKITPIGLRDFIHTQVSLRGLGLACCGVNGDAVNDEVTKISQT